MNPPDGSPTLSESLSTVGYAMFALVRRAPLDEIRPMNDFIAEVVHQHVPANPVEPTVPDPVAEPAPEPVAEARRQSVGMPIAGDLILPDPPEPVVAIRRPAPEPVAAAPEPEAEPEVFDMQPEPEPEPAPATPSLDRGKAAPTLTMLQEISFLDE